MRPLLSYKPSKLAMRRSHRIEAITHIISTLIIVAPNKQHFNRKLLNNLSRRCLKKFLNKPFSHEVKADCNDLKGRLVQDFFAMYNTILFGDTHSSLTLYGRLGMGLTTRPVLWPWISNPKQPSRSFSIPESARDSQCQSLIWTIRKNIIPAIHNEIHWRRGKAFVLKYCRSGFNGLFNTLENF